jgi:hypothetical protein
MFSISELMENFGDIYPQCCSFDINYLHDPKNGQFASHGERLAEHLNKAVKDKNFKETLLLGNVQNAEAIQRITKFSVKTRLATADNLRHAYNRHGEGALTLQPDEIRLTEGDFKNYPDVVNNPDAIALSAHLSNMGLPAVLYGKKDKAGHLVIVEEVLYGGVLGFKTMYKTKVKPKWWK